MHFLDILTVGKPSVFGLQNNGSTNSGCARSGNKGMWRREAIVTRHIILGDAVWMRAASATVLGMNGEVRKKVGVNELEMLKWWSLCRKYVWSMTQTNPLDLSILSSSRYIKTELILPFCFWEDLAMNLVQLSLHFQLSFPEYREQQD